MGVFFLSKSTPIRLEKAARCQGGVVGTFNDVGVFLDVVSAAIRPESALARCCIPPTILCPRGVAIVFFLFMPSLVS